MLHWVSQHSDALLVAINVGVLAVWVFYAQLLLGSLRRQRRARLLINEVKGRDMDAEIIVANMSAEVIFVQMLMAIVVSDGEEFTHTITDVYVEPDEVSDQPAERHTSQGPLASGDCMHLGSFRRIARLVSPGPNGETQ